VLWAKCNAEPLKELRAELDKWLQETEDRVPAQRRPDEYDPKTGQALKK